MSSVDVSLIVCLMTSTLASFVHPKERYRESSQHQHAPSWRLYQVYSRPHPNDIHDIHYYKPHFPKYEFEYIICDKKSGDHKRHHEAREGGRVVGEYSVLESGSSLRKVQYEADDLHGFNVVVSKYFNKHGDDAYSTFTRTNYITPTSGYNIKINHSLTPKEKSKEMKMKDKSENKSKSAEDLKLIMKHEDKTLTVKKNKVANKAISNPEEIRPVVAENASYTQEIYSVADSEADSFNSTKVVPIMSINETREQSNEKVSKINTDARPKDVNSGIASSFYKVSRVFHFV